MHTFLLLKTNKRRKNAFVKNSIVLKSSHITQVQCNNCNVQSFIDVADSRSTLFSDYKNSLNKQFLLDIILNKIIDFVD